MSLTIREARKADAHAMKGFMQGLWEESLDVIYRRPAPPTLEDEIQFIESMESESNSRLFLAFMDDNLAGMLDLHGFSHPQRRHCAVFGMSVARAFRRAGIGRALLENMVRHVETGNGFTRLELEVFATNHAAIRLYESMQFEIEGRKRAAVQINGEFVDMLVMARLLENTCKNR